MANVRQNHSALTPPSKTRSERHDKPLVDESEIEGSMHTEEPMGWDQAPQAIKDPRQKRHPRPDGVGGLIPADESERNVDDDGKPRA